MEHYKKMKICIACGKAFKKPKGIRGKAWRIRKYCNQACYLSHHTPWNKGIKSWVKPWLGKKRPDMNGCKNPAWKGNDAHYNSIHMWVRKIWKKPEKCEFCGDESKRLHWANKDHKYRRNKGAWLGLCASCHKKHDIEKGIFALPSI